MTSPDRTISIPVSAATHVAIGCIIGLLAIVAFFVYVQLPAQHAHYRGGALALGIVGAVAALIYWLWCTSQCLRTDVKANAGAIEDARAEIRTAKAEVLAKLDTVTAHVGEIDAVVTENKGAIKEHTDAVDQLKLTLEAVATALNALKECYLQEGTIPPKEGPPETW